MYHIEFDIDLKRNPYKGLYIVVEGIDASGKSTQVTNIVEYFKKKGQEVVVTSEPRKEGSEVGKLIHQVLQSKINIPSRALQYLYTSERIINHESVVIPSLKSGKPVVSHRCFWSAVVYGIMDRGENEYDFSEATQLMIAQGILAMYHQFIVPDITFYLKISPHVAMERLSQMDKVKEIYEKKEKLEKIAQGYDWLLTKFPKEFVVIDAEKSEDDVLQELIQHIEIKNK